MAGQSLCAGWMRPSLRFAMGAALMVSAFLHPELSLSEDKSLHDALLDKIIESDPAVLEELSIKLMLAMDYGTSGYRTGGTGDGGIDAVICKDFLGLDTIKIQTKRYRADNTVGAATIREFSGALNVGGTGVFITTSSFSSGAKETAKNSDKKIILINGEELTRLMIEYEVSVKNSQGTKNPNQSCLQTLLDKTK